MRESNTIASAEIELKFTINNTISYLIDRRSIFLNLKN